MKACEPTSEGFRRSGVVFFDEEKRTLQGQKGMVDAGANALQRALRAKGVAKRPRLKAMTGKVAAGESHRRAIAAEFWMQ